MKTTDLQEASCSVRLCTTDHDNDYFYNVFSTWTEPDDEWIHRSIPIGPYWKTTDESRLFRWIAGTGAVAAPGGNAVWTTINSIAFRVTPTIGNDCDLFLDDLHFSGKITREAVDTSEVTAYTEYQLPIISRDALDDSAVASDDTGMAGAMAYAEMLRRVNIPRTLHFTTEMKPLIKPGEYFSVNAAEKLDGTYNISAVDFRVTQYIHSIDSSGFLTDFVVTDDVLNSFPITKLDERSLFNEFMLVNNDQAKNMRSGGEIDLLIPHLRKAY
jgi:hypothetical protein